jgi:hypothetical protein
LTWFLFVFSISIASVIFSSLMLNTAGVQCAVTQGMKLFNSMLKQCRMQSQPLLNTALSSHFVSPHFFKQFCVA